MRTTALGRVERFKSLSMACVPNRYTPGVSSVTLVDVPVKQQVPLRLRCCPIHKSQATGPPSGSVTGKLTVIVDPVGPSVGDTVRVPDGGNPGLGAGETATFWLPCAPPPRPSATEASYETNAVLARDGAVKETELPLGSGKRVLSM